MNSENELNQTGSDTEDEAELETTLYADAEGNYETVSNADADAEFDTVSGPETETEYGSKTDTEANFDEVLNFDFLAEQNSTTLPGSGLGLRDLPPLSNFGHVTVLELDGNYLSVLPPTIVTDLPVLEKLDVARNKLTALPDNIGDWECLREISAPFNLITYLPPSMSKLVGLNYLNLDYNPLNPTLRTILDFEREWNAIQYRLFARQVHLVALQLPHAIMENNRALKKFEHEGMPPPPYQLNPPVPKKRKTKGQRPQAKPKRQALAVKESHMIEGRRSSVLQFLEALTPPIFRSGSIASGDFQTQLKQFPDESESQSGEGSENSLLLHETQITTIGVWFWIRELIILFFNVIFATLKLSVYTLCFFACVVVLSGMYLDRGVLLEFLQYPAISNLIPDSARKLLVGGHDAILHYLSAICGHFPIYRSLPAPGWLIKLLCLIAGAWTSFTSWIASIRQ